MATAAKQRKLVSEAIQPTTTSPRIVFSVELHQVLPTSSDLHFDFSCTALPSEPPTRGPYLQSGSHTSAVVRWRTDFPSESWVYYGDTQGNLTVTSIVSAITSEHAVTVTGLLPDTRYYYAIGDSDTMLAGDDTNHFWVTHPIAKVPTIPTRKRN